VARFVQISDFETGELKISSTVFQEGGLQDVINEVEPNILQSMLGCALYDDMVADWDAVTAGKFSEDRFIDIYNPFCKDDGCNQVKSEGFPKMLQYFVYFEYMRIQAFQNRTTGMKKTDSENSEIASFPDYGLFTKYNKGIHTYCAIQWFICKNELGYDYSKYNGQPKQLMSWL